jgi:hypothetical protein
MSVNITKDQGIIILFIGFIIFFMGYMLIKIKNGDWVFSGFFIAAIGLVMFIIGFSSLFKPVTTINFI